MQVCPNCGERAVPFWRKWLSQPTLPARCHRCGTLSYVPTATGSIGLAVATLVGLAGGAAALWLHAAWPLALALPAGAALYARHWHRVALEPLAGDAVRQARQVEGLGVLAVLMVVVFR